MKGPIVFMFPGQGSQRLGMGKDLFESFAYIRQNFFEAADDLLGYKLSELCFSGDEQQLKSTQYAQPAIYMVSMALHALFEEYEIGCSAVIGHSLGEFSAVAAAKGFTFLEGLQIVAERGRLMQQAQQTHSGSMAAIMGLEVMELEEICKTYREEGVITIANYNGPSQLVISGEDHLVEKAMLEAAAAGAERVVKLPVSGAFHSQLIANIIPSLKKKIEGIQLQELQVPIVSNVNIDFVTDQKQVSQVLLDQAIAPVKWEHVVRKVMRDIQVDEFVEIGPGRVLSGLVRQLDTSAKVVNIDSLKKFEAWQKN
ncbi:ACP S-malonyltransferase [Paenibacillus endoradicis]|uniref:ACP S-malonyltransferase n=1 Tax=Paenibacillus endoradicis TaxID=2972487 RepID=UPI0021596178|nr:ACP S-malonyltransferase [Paenibacillus endoradicis]MCR8657745.1 ACP S-malonyltransferase [Paenibacillus endoradicis]